MSSNIGPEAQAAYQKYLDAGSLDEKIKRLEEFLSLVPKHKATEKIVALNRSRLAKLKRQQEEHKQRLKSLGKKSPFSIKKEGIQVILISDYYNPGVGKSSILNYLTGAAKKKIGKFTSIPEIGIYKFKKIKFQIVDMPSIMEGASKGVGNGKEILAQIRSSDLICFCIDLSRNFENQMNLILTELSNADIKINIPPPPITIEKTGSNKIQIFYLSSEAQNMENMEDLNEQIIEVVQEAGIRNGIVKIYGEITLAQVVDALTPSVVYKDGIILATKGDLPHTETAYLNLKNHYSSQFPLIIGTSIKKNNFPNKFGEIILEYLDKIKIYTMNISGKVAEKPLIMDKGSTVKDVAFRIHKSFKELFDYAVVIREGARQKKKRVGIDYKLKDNDIIEIHTV
ncbi:MAG: TGS domain-containing protein [Promethearchaeota archaeon]|nr:MAG: TGS domain-containing protein [Candidatus Lokiarchaeota archaeon]